MSRCLCMGTLLIALSTASDETAHKAAVSAGYPALWGCRFPLQRPDRAESAGVSSPLGCPPRICPTPLIHSELRPGASPGNTKWIVCAHAVDERKGPVPAMRIDDLRPGLLVQQNVTISSGTRDSRNGSFALLFQVCAIQGAQVTCRWLFTRMRGGEAHFPSRAGVYTFTEDGIGSRLQPATQPLIEHYFTALDTRKALAR